MRRYYLVRHAQTVWNGENRLQGHSDLPLSELGLRQAECLGTFFASRELRGICTSHLQRSRQTARAIAAHRWHASELEVHPGLAEMHLGDWEGLTPEEIDQRFDGAYRQWSVRPSSVTIPRAEPLDRFRARVSEAAQRLLKDFNDEGEYVIVSHGGVIAALLADALEADYDVLLRRLRLDNAGVTALDFDGNHSHVLWVNFTAHLDALVKRTKNGGLNSSVPDNSPGR